MKLSRFEGELMRFMASPRRRVGETHGLQVQEYNRYFMRFIDEGLIALTGTAWEITPAGRSALAAAEGEEKI